jgi:polar amino acid transport system substrate-binding protein
LAEVEKATADAVLRYDLGGTAGWVPYGFTGDNKKPGIFGEVAAAIMAEAKVPAEAVFLSPKRAEMAMLEGRLDFDFISPDWFKDGNVGEKFVTTLPLFVVREYFVTLPENQHLYSEPSSAYGQAVGTVAGYFYYDDDHFTRVDFLSENELVLGLEKNRFNVAILERYTALYWAQKHQIEIAFAALHTAGKMVIRLHKKYEHLLPQINQAILQLQEQEAIENILLRYQGVNPTQ